MIDRGSVVHFAIWALAMVTGSASSAVFSTTFCAVSPTTSPRIDVPSFIATTVVT